MKKILFFVWVISSSISICALLPTSFPYGDNLNETNQLYGNYLQSTGGDFSILKETLDSELLGNKEKVFEINLTGNHPAQKYNFSKDYEFLTSKFILKGKIKGKENIDGLGEYYIFHVTDYKLAEYLPILWSSNNFLFYIFPFALMLSIISSVWLICLYLTNILRS